MITLKTFKFAICSTVLLLGLGEQAFSSQCRDMITSICSQNPDEHAMWFQIQYTNRRCLEELAHLPAEVINDFTTRVQSEPLCRMSEGRVPSWLLVRHWSCEIQIAVNSIEGVESQVKIELCQ